MFPVISRVTSSVVSIVITPPKGSRGPVLVYVPPCTVYVPPEVIVTSPVPGEIVFAAAVPTAISLPLLKRATPSVKSSSTSTASSVSSSSWDSERSWISTSPLSSTSSVSGSSAASKITSSLSSPSSNSCISTSAAQMRDSGTTDVISTVPVRIAESSFRLFFANSFFFILFLLPHFIFYENIILYRTKLGNAHQKPKKCLFF